jgi:hypothetical protein
MISSSHEGYGINTSSNKNVRECLLFVNDLYTLTDDKVQGDFHRQARLYPYNI